MSWTKLIIILKPVGEKASIKKDIKLLHGVIEYKYLF